jgi:hypothetical protein
MASTLERGRIRRLLAVLLAITATIMTIYLSINSVYSTLLWHHVDVEMIRIPQEPTLPMTNHDNLYKAGLPLTNHYNRYNVCTKGEPGFSRQWLREEFAQFMKIYDQRPKFRNIYGTQLPHQFAMWATVR